MSIVISVSTRTALECALPCDYSGKKTDKFSKHGYKICSKRVVSTNFKLTKCTGRLNNVECKVKRVIADVSNSVDFDINSSPDHYKNNMA